MALSEARLAHPVPPHRQDFPTMSNASTLIGLYVAVVVGVAFLLSHLRTKRRPDLGQFSGVFLAAVAAVVAADFGLDVMRAASACVSACEDQRLPMVLGAIAVEWISISQLVKSFHSVLSTS